MKNKNLIVVYSARTYQWVIPVPLINLSAYWILSSMFLVIYYTAIMQFSISSKNSLYPLQKVKPPHNTTPLWNQNFQSHLSRFFTKIFVPQFWRQGACHDVTKSAGSQTNEKISENDSVIAEFYKNIYQKTYLPNDSRLRISVNKKVLEKSQIWLRHTLVPSLPSRNKFW